LNGWLEDVRFALGGLVRERRFTIPAALILALVVGTNAAIFSLAQAVLVRPIEVADLDRLVLVDPAGPAGGRVAVPVTTLLRWKKESRSLAGLSGYDLSLALLGDGEGAPERVLGADVAADFFDVLGGRVALGRTFESHEVAGGHEDVVVLSDSLWKRRFGGDPRAVGKTLLIGETPFTVVGVMAPAFAFPLEVELWYPAHQRTAAGSPAMGRVFGRLAPGATVESAEEELAAIDERGARTDPGIERRGGPRLEPLRHLDLTGASGVLDTVLGASYFLLFIGCANLATQLLARSLGRRKEIATRLALGASRARIVRQLLTESVLLALTGAALGALVARWLIDVSRYLFSSLDFLPGFRGAGLDAGTGGYLAAVGLGTGVLFGLVPALQLARTDSNEVLKEAGRAYTGGRRTRFWRDAFIVTQVGLAVLVAFGGITFASLLDRVMRHKGFETSAVTSASLQLAPERYDTITTTAALTDRLFGQLRALPGVTAAALVHPAPYDRDARREPVTVEGLPAPGGPRRAYRRVATAGLGTVLSIPLLRGRAISDGDRDPARPVAVVSQSFVDAFLPRGMEPIGHRLSFGPSADGKTRWPIIVGVIADVEQTPSQGMEPTVYLSAHQWHLEAATVLVRGAGELAGPLQALLRSVPGLFVVRLGPFHDFVLDRMTGFRLLANVTLMFGVMALLIAAVGLNGATSFLVAERTNEIGVRAAIGATPGPLLGLVMAKGLLLTAFGLAIGAGAAVPAARYIETVLYAFGALDPRVLAVAAGAVLAVTVLGSLVPGLRASRLPPALALHHD
jgi:putative ABC transport system permease protein